MYGTFSVPARRPPSWPAPWMQRLQPHAAADVQHAHPLRGVQLVPRHGQQIDAEFLHVQRQLARGLGGVGMQQHAFGPCESGDLPDGLQRADLVVGVHDADQIGPFRDHLSHSVGIDAAAAVHRHDGDAAAEPLEEFARLGRGGMLHGADDDVRPAAQRPKTPRSRAKATPLIARLLASLPPPVNTISSGWALSSSATWRRACSTASWAFLPRRVRAGGVAEVFPQVRQHRLNHAGIERRGGVVVEVDRSHLCTSDSTREATS